MIILCMIIDPGVDRSGQHRPAVDHGRPPVDHDRLLASEVDSWSYDHIIYILIRCHLAQAYSVRVEETTVHRFLHGSEERGVRTRDPYTRRKAMATMEQLQQMLERVMTQQAEAATVTAAKVAEAATTAASAAASDADKKATISMANLELTNKNMMENFMKVIREEAAARTTDEATSKDKTDKK